MQMEILLAENQVNYDNLYCYPTKNISIKPFHIEFNFISCIPAHWPDTISDQLLLKIHTEYIPVKFYLC